MIPNKEDFRENVTTPMGTGPSINYKAYAEAWEKWCIDTSVNALIAQRTKESILSQLPTDEEISQKFPITLNNPRNVKMAFARDGAEWMRDKVKSILK